MNVIALSGAAFVVSLIGVCISWCEKNERSSHLQALQKQVL